MVPPTIRETLASARSTFQIMVPRLAPILWAASITPWSTSKSDDSTNLATKGAAAKARGTIVAVAP